MFLNDFDLVVKDGEFVSILGPSGCGKTTTLRMIAGFERATEGEIYIGDHCVSSSIKGSFAPPEKRDIGMVFQSYAVWPHMTVAENVGYPLKIQKVDKKEREERVQKMLELVHLGEYSKRYPHQLSGGLRQRVMIGMAMVCRPKVMIADEPTTALDVTIQAQIIELLLELQQKENMALVLITHDLALVAEAAHKIIVMYAGQVVETGDAHAIFHAPRHPYTQALLRALPEFAQDKERLASLPGVVPGKYDRPNGCLLNPRCPYATDRCRAEEPALNMLADGRQSKCHYPLDDAGRPTL